jgi:hypothetical protein
VSRATRLLIDGLTRALGPPVATPEWISADGGEPQRARYRVFRWRCPSCHAGESDPDLIWRPFVVDSDGRVWCGGPHCSTDELLATLRTTTAP